MTNPTEGQDGSLGRRIRRGAGWIVGGAVLGNVLRLISNLIMTRLLMPEAFGMLALASTILTAINLSTDMGIYRSITREADGGDLHFLRVAWVVKFLRSAMISAAIILVAVLMWWFAPYYAPSGTIYAQPEMPGVVAMIALAPLMRGAGSTTWELAARNLDLRSKVIWALVPQVLSILAMIAFAQITPTVWALMCGMLTNQLVQSVATHIFLPGPTMRFEWDKEIADRLWRFGKWIMASSFLRFISRNADKFVLGGLLGSNTFGLFVIAQIWVNAGRLVVGQISDGIGFPAIAEASRTRPDDLPRLYRRFQFRIDGICVVACLVSVLGGPVLVEALYPAQYAESGRYLQLMAFVFLVLRFSTMTNLVLNAGNSKAMVVTAAIQAVASIALMYAGYRHIGLEGAILGVVLAPLSSLPYVLYLVRPILGAHQTRIDAFWGIAVLGVILLGFRLLTGTLFVFD